MKITKISERREFATFLKLHRKAVGWTLTQMAEAMGITKSQLHNYESERNLPRNQEEIERKAREAVKAEIRRRRMEEYYNALSQRTQRIEIGFGIRDDHRVGSA